MTFQNTPFTLLDGDGFSWTIAPQLFIDAGSERGIDFFLSSGDVRPGAYSFDENGREANSLAYASFGNLIVTRSLYISPTDGFVRVLDSFTNIGTASQSFTYDFDNNYGPFDAVSTGSNGDRVIDANDIWVVFDDNPGSPATPDNPAAGTLWGDGSLAPSRVFANRDSVDLDFTTDIAAGQTVSFLSFASQGTTSSDVVATFEGAFDANGVLSSDFLVGLDSSERGSIVNFAGLDAAPQLTGTNGIDDLVGTSGADLLQGFGGDDVIVGLGGNDLIDGGTGRDIIEGGDGDDEILGGGGGDLIDGGAGDDIIGSDALTQTTTSNVTTIPSTGESLSISLTMPDANRDTSVVVEGFVGRGGATSNTINIAVVVDISRSTNDIFSGAVSVPDLNGDGRANTVLDAEIQAIQTLVDSLVRDVGAGNASIALIPFDSSASTVYTGRVSTDANGNGRFDIVDAATRLNDGGNTSFDAGLGQAVSFFDNALPGQNFVFFLSDGVHNGGDYTDEVATLLDRNGIGATIRSFGVTTQASEADLDLVDDGRDNDSAIIVSDPSSLAADFVRSPIALSDVDRVEILVDGRVVRTLPPSSLVETPLGLRFEERVTGLSATRSEVISVRVIASDPANTVIGTGQRLEVLPNEPGADVILGGAGNDTIASGTDNDTVYGGADDDDIDGGSGNDLLNGGTGDDTIDGGSGNDSIRGSTGDDVLSGFGGNDDIAGGDGDDIVAGNAGNDAIAGQRGDDLLIGGAGSDTIFGGGGNDTASWADLSVGVSVNLTSGAMGGGAAGDRLFLIENLIGTRRGDQLVGDAGANELLGLDGNDRLFGADGNDTLAGGTGGDLLSGGNGRDMADYSASGSGVAVNLSRGTASGGDAAGDRLVNIEDLRGSGFGDLLVGTIGDNLLIGGGGSDGLYGSAGDDVLDGGDGNDRLDGGGGADLIRGGDGNDRLEGGFGNDVLEGGRGADTVIGNGNFDSIS